MHYVNNLNNVGTAVPFGKEGAAKPNTSGYQRELPTPVISPAWYGDCPSALLKSSHLQRGL